MALVLGGGLSGLSFSFYLNQPAVILEKEDQLGGLCRSFDFNGIFYDIGPHIFFSKNKEILASLLSLTDTHQIRRSNQIFYKNRLIKYPFENDLAALPEAERDYCLQEFLNNPYAHYQADNMLQFFLKTFGEGITRTYLQPYNEKIWKFDPSCMDTQMVERIPKPPKEDVIKSAQGIPTDGYTHQLFFNYPIRQGMQSVIDGMISKLAPLVEIKKGVHIESLQRIDSIWKITTSQGVFQSQQVINTMPLQELFTYLSDVPEAIRLCLDQLIYNSIYIVMLQVKKEAVGNNFALYFPDKNTIFHRLSKLNYLGDSYCLPDQGTTLMAEITFRPNSYLSTLSSETIKQRVIQDLINQNLICGEDILDCRIQRFKYAYVVYDLHHRQNIQTVLSYLESIGIYSCGRFAECEYLNMDGILEHSQQLAKKLTT